MDYCIGFGNGGVQGTPICPNTQDNTIEVGENAYYSQYHHDSAFDSKTNDNTFQVFDNVRKHSKFLNSKGTRNNRRGKVRSKVNTIRQLHAEDPMVNSANVGGMFIGSPGGILKPLKFTAVPPLSLHRKQYRGRRAPRRQRNQTILHYGRPYNRPQLYPRLDSGYFSAGPVYDIMKTPSCVRPVVEDHQGKSEYFVGSSLWGRELEAGTSMSHQNAFLDPHMSNRLFMASHFYNSNNQASVVNNAIPGQAFPESYIPMATSPYLPLAGSDFLNNESMQQGYGEIFQFQQKYSQPHMTSNKQFTGLPMQGCFRQGQIGDFINHEPPFSLHPSHSNIPEKPYCQITPEYTGVEGTKIPNDSHDVLQEESDALLVEHSSQSVQSNKVGESQKMQEVDLAEAIAMASITTTLGHGSFFDDDSMFDKAFSSVRKELDHIVSSTIKEISTREDNMLRTAMIRNIHSHTAYEDVIPRQGNATLYNRDGCNVFVGARHPSSYVGQQHGYTWSSNRSIVQGSTIPSFQGMSIEEEDLSDDVSESDSDTDCTKTRDLRSSCGRPFVWLKVDSLPHHGREHAWKDNMTF